MAIWDCYNQHMKNWDNGPMPIKQQSIFITEQDTIDKETQVTI